MLRFAALSAAAVVACVLSSAIADDTKLNVKEGDKFPNVPLAAAQIEKSGVKADAKTVSIADLKGKNVVVFFYPKALTKGCTVESCGFRDLAAKFPKDTVVIGASGDDEMAQSKFIADHKLPFALLADTQKKLIDPLGIGKGTPRRVTYVIDREGKIAKVYTEVKPASHPAEVLAFVESLK